MKFIGLLIDPSCIDLKDCPITAAIFYGEPMFIPADWPELM